MSRRGTAFLSTEAALRPGQHQHPILRPQRVPQGFRTGRVEQHRVVERRHGAQQIAQTRRAGNVGQPISSALFAGTDDHFLPVPQFARCPCGVELDLAAFAVHWSDGGDAQFRGYTASQTLARWPKVRAGEERHIFPFQNEADIFFNSGLAYELAVLKLWAEPRLAAVTIDDPNYGTARSLIDLLSTLLPIDAGVVPPTSLLREFVGGSGFNY